MKYLKAYKLFESIDLNHLVSTINDISLELTDEGYKVITQLKDDDSIKIKVTSPRKESLYSKWRQDRENSSVKEYNKCKEVLDRIDELLVSNKLSIDSKNGYNIDVTPWTSYTDMEYGICSAGYDSTGTWTYEMTYTSLDVNESKTFESNSNMIDDVEDMLLDLYDDNKYLVVKYASTDRNCDSKSDFVKANEKYYNWNTPSYTQDDLAKSLTEFDTWSINIKPEPKYKYNGYNSDVSGNKARVDLDEVKDIVIQIHNYAKSKGYDVKIKLEQNLYVSHNGYVQDGDINFYGVRDIRFMKDGFQPASVTIIINK